MFASAALITFSFTNKQQKLAFPTLKTEKVSQETQMRSISQWPSVIAHIWMKTINVFMTEHALIFNNMRRLRKRWSPQNKVWSTIVPSNFWKMAHFGWPAPFAALVYPGSRSVRLQKYFKPKPRGGKHFRIERKWQLNPATSLTFNSADAWTSDQKACLGKASVLANFSLYASLRLSLSLSRRVSNSVQLSGVL